MPFSNQKLRSRLVGTEEGMGRRDWEEMRNGNCNQDVVRKRERETQR